MLKILAVMTGGSLGAASRYSLFMLVQRLAGERFPAGTLAANLLGSFLIGLLWSLFEGTRLTNEWRLFIFTGFLGRLYNLFHLHPGNHPIYQTRRMACRPALPGTQ